MPSSLANEYPRQVAEVAARGAKIDEFLLGCGARLRERLTERDSQRPEIAWAEPLEFDPAGILTASRISTLTRAG